MSCTSEAPQKKRCTSFVGLVVRLRFLFVRPCAARSSAQVTWTRGRGHPTVPGARWRWPAIAPPPIHPFSLRLSLRENSSRSCEKLSFLFFCFRLVPLHSLATPRRPHENSAEYLLCRSVRRTVSWLGHVYSVCSNCTARGHNVQYFVSCHASCSTNTFSTSSRLKR